MLPLVLVLVTNWLALILEPHLIEVRTAMPATALLTAVFLQQSSLAGLPEVSELVLMDSIYLLSYGLIAFTFSQIVYDNFRLRGLDDADGDVGPGGDDGDRTRTIRRWGHRSLAVQVAVATAVIAWLLQRL